MYKGPERLKSASNTSLTPVQFTENLFSAATIIAVVGGIYGGAKLSSGITGVVLDATAATESLKYYLTGVATIPGIAIFGLAIPAEVFRRTFSLTWPDFWNRLKS